jgi:hypothetical protein
MSAGAARGTVEMLSAPERVKVSTDGPSQPSSLQAMKTGKTPVLEGAAQAAGLHSGHDVA